MLAKKYENTPRHHHEPWARHHIIRNGSNDHWTGGYIQISGNLTKDEAHEMIALFTKAKKG